MGNHHPYSGGVFSKTIPGGRAGVDIHLRGDGVHAQMLGGDKFFVPYTQCHVEIGGSSGRMVVCGNQDRTLTIFCEQKGFYDALGRESGGILLEALGQQRGGRRAERRRGWILLAVCVVAIGGVLVGCYRGFKVGVRVAVNALPMSVDETIGTLAIERMDVGELVVDPVIVGAIEKIIARLSPHAVLDEVVFQVRVVDSPAVNAFALPGGYIVIYTGLITESDSAEQVAGVLGHEMAHITLRHGLKRVAQSIGLIAAIQLFLGDTQGLATLGAKILQTATLNSYSRAQEKDADFEGVRMLYASGINPMGLVEFFESLGGGPGGLADAVSWASTHPEHGQRIEAIRRQLAEMPAKTYLPVDVDWSRVQRGVQGLEVNLENPQEAS